ncbi:MAG TPA: twin-arginine translocation signal domain-containing protein [Pyrinomonadaceae bacterium]
MHITRRNFLHTIGAAACLAALADIRIVFGQRTGDPELFPLPAETYSDTLYSVTARHFGRFIGRRFTATSAEGISTELVLLEVNPIERLGNTTRGFYGESFSLIFESRAKHRLFQDTYSFRVEGMDQFSALLVPTGRRGRQYEIIINHVTR